MATIQSISPKRERTAVVADINEIQRKIHKDAPFGWKCLEKCRKAAPKIFYFGIAALDEIAAGENWDKHQESLYDGTYLVDVLPHIAWWIDVAEALTHGRSEDIDFFDSTDPERMEFRKTVSLMVNDVLSCYAVALNSTPSFRGSQCRPDEVEGLEMFKRYRLFARLVRDYSHKVWPEKNLNWLWAQS